MTGAVDASGWPLPDGLRPRRIVSLVPSISETVHAVGAADRLVAVTDYCVWPPDAFPEAARVRGTKNPHVARILDLEPDLVLANLEENRERDVVRLREAGVPVHVSYPRDLAGAAETVRTIAELIGEPAAGARIAARMDEAAEVAAAAAPESPIATLCPIWRRPWMAVGEGCYAAELLELCGLRTVPRRGERYPRFEPEDVGDEVEAVLLPSEPYEFREEHLAEWDDRGVPVRLVDGALLTWHGPRTVEALGYFTGVATELRGELSSGGP